MGDMVTESDLRQYIAELENRSARLEDVAAWHAQVEADLRVSEEKFRALADTSSDWIWEIDESGAYTYASAMVEQILGYRPDEVLGKAPFDFMPDDEAQRVQALLRDLIAAGEPIVALENVVLHRDGRRIVLETSGVPITNEAGKVIGYRGVDRDITARRLVERERELLMAAIEQGAEAVFITDTEGAIQYANPTFEKMTGYLRKEAIGQNPRILKSGVQDAAFYQDMWNTLLAGKTWAGRIVNKRKDGSLFTEEATISPIRDASGQTANYVAVKRDITESIKIEEQLRQAQKMESIGRLAGGVAHDFNNMLLVILGHTEIAMEGLDANSPRYAALVEIRRAAKRSADLTRQLLAFARKQTIAPKVLDLNATISGMLSMLQRVIGEDIELSWRPGPGVWPVKMDPSQIDQILANLCVNSRDAIAGVGRVTIETDNVCFDDAFCAGRRDYIPGEYVSLEVSDNGRGMDAAVRERLFEPFFTTKEMGKGTGLGLSTVYGLVEQNGGFIDVCSVPGRGASFKIYLVRYEGEASDLPETGPVGSLEVGSETILVVEDEVSILKMISSMLQRFGYHVLVASSPGEALRVAEVHGRKIDLLITDVIMPGMNGSDLVAELLHAFPAVKPLYMSGYTADVIAQRGVLSENTSFIQKPFAMRDLANKVREVLDDS